MAFLQVGASRIRYDAYGDGPALILAHGVGGNRVSWFRQVPHFSQRYRVVVFDHRAFGGSEDVEGEGRSRYVGDLLALLDELEIETAILVGQSMGGGTCAAFTCQYPHRVRALVVADSLAGIQVPEPLASALRATSEANRQLSQVERVLGPSIRLKDPESTHLYLQLATFNSVNVHTVRGVMPRWSPAVLAEAGVPTLFVAGQSDILFTSAQIAAVQALVPNSHFIEIEDAGHSAYFEQPARFNAALDAFLDGLLR
ncbi:alpha/beta fold hydrolase [Sphingomonas crocodyli]|uniref:Alpha/beta hydrolase n=1 Tax=Sphingomonas crocodyli TaxID=1979270 RepID=A0A437M5Z1_9SPHN|nr:alpha/beta hydrolase [Sphingomonas crocodyli]RVT92946.1 alpha/beta hydrolase [Sphingomonas crocodyli]